MRAHASRLVILHGRAVLDDAGQSLVEMAVVAGLLLVVLSAVFASVTLATNSSQTAAQGFDAVSQSQTVLEDTSKDIRAAIMPQTGVAPFLSATTTSVEFYVSEGQGNVNGPQVIDLNLSGSRLVRETTNPLPPPAAPLSYPSTPDTTAVLGDNIVGSGALFTYYDQNNNLLTPQSGGTLSSTQLGQIGYVKITVTTSDRTSAPSTTLSTTVLVRNLYYTWLQQSP